MAEMIGMNPEEVEAHRTAIAGQIAALESAHAAVNRVRLASLDPFNYGIVPGSLVLAPTSIITATVATALVDGARSSAHNLVGQLLAQIAQQRDASAANGGDIGPRVRGNYKTDAATLALVATLSPSELRKLLHDNPAFAKAFQAATSNPTAVATWWKSMDADPNGTTLNETASANQKELISEFPSLIGNLDGVPYWARNEANVTTLNRELNDPKTDAADRKALEAVKTALGQGMNGTPPRELVSLGLGTNPTAAISVGDLDKASYASYLIPGMGTNVAGNMSDYTNAALGMRSTQAQVGHVDASKIAVVAWLNYTPPNSSDVVGVAHDYLADAGAVRLTSALNGFQAVHSASGVSNQLSVIAHSYGTDVATLALTSAHADHLVLLGSAGISTTIHNASDLHVPVGQVFASQGEHDGWAPVGQSLSGRQDPTAASFGARDFSSETSTTAQGAHLSAISQHGPLVHAGNPDGYSYLDNNTSAQYDAAKATMGQGSQLAVGDTPADRLALQVGDRVKTMESWF